MQVRRNALTPNERLFRNPRGARVASAAAARVTCWRRAGYVFPRGTTPLKPSPTGAANDDDDGDKMQ